MATVVLQSSWRISFLYTQYSNKKSGYRAIFKFTEASNLHFTNNLSHSRNPDLHLSPENNFHLVGSPCHSKKSLYDLTVWGQNFPNLTKINIVNAITIEYVRELNQIYFYLNGTKLAPLSGKDPRPESNCYEVQSDFYVGKTRGEMADVGISKFTYEGNFSGQPLGGLTVEEIQAKMCLE